ncbi:proline-rich protein HaeIII subfamily 1-like [Oncorhynchus tshawytscha]|uniref:proline-rich protein HaeIII subfamily 1-like n=1 Tax=Oncorhynchus tshawytscha TaxID=74940 RepID=UPI000D09E2CC|nr:proline-rich protein HaeIII subfamily 1-like [Oncorhynchus tshawytscha]
MEYLCVVILLFSAVATHADPWRQLQQGDSRFLPFGGPQQSPDRHPMRPNGRDPWMKDGSLPPFGGQPIGGGGENSRPIGGGPTWQGWDMGGTGNPGWPDQDQMPPWYPNRPSGGPGSGDTQRLMGGPESGGPLDYPDRDYKRREDEGQWWNQGTMRGDRGSSSPADLPPVTGSDFGYAPNGPRPHPGQGTPRGPGSRWRRPAGPPRGGRPNMRNLDARPDRNPIRPSAVPSGAGGRPPFDDTIFGGRLLQPEMVGNREFIPIFQADNVTLQNASGLPLKEGENIFLLPKGGRGTPPPRHGHKRPQELGFGYPHSSGFQFQPYLKLIYNPSATNKISFEYGITTLLPSFMKAEETKTWEEEGK